MMKKSRLSFSFPVELILGDILYYWEAHYAVKTVSFYHLFRRLLLSFEISFSFKAVPQFLRQSLLLNLIFSI